MNDPRRAPDDVDPLLRAVFDALPVGIVYLDAALTVLRANPAGLRAFALRPDDLGRPFFEVTGMSPSLAPAFRAVVASGEGYTFWGLPLSPRGEGEAPAYFDVTVERLSSDPASRGGALVVAVEVTARVEAERGAQDAIDTARRAAEAVRATFEQMIDGVVVCDLDGTIVASNEAARALLGERLGDGTATLTGVDGAPVADGDAPWSRAARGETVTDEQVIAARGPGAASVALSVNAGPLRDERGRVEGAVAVLRDLTEAQRAVAALRVANQRLAENNRLKGEFVANMSHELRTPLNAILGFAQLLRLGPEGRGLSPRQLDGVERIHRNGKNLLSLIDGILDVARIEAGVRTLHPEHFDVVEAVQSAFGELESLAAQRGVAYRMRVEGEFPVAFTDRGRLRQVVVNLLSNALKFTVEGGVELALSREGDRARIEVRDTGVGIRSEDLGLIFEKFRQVDGSTTRRAGGVGLGLNIVRELVDLLGGEVSVRSAYGEGSAFTVLVPLLGPSPGDAEPDPAAEPDPPPAGAEEPSPAPTVLVIEDNPDSAALLRVTLERAGLRVRVADNGVSGLRLARALRPSAITLDIMMPRMDGWRVLQALRADEATAETPVIVCSIVDNRLLGYRLGASEYLTKPVDPAALFSALARVGAVPDAGDVLVVDDEHAMREMVREALREVGIATREASSGEQALAMVAERAPRAVFIDLFMPGGMSGFEFLARMRSAPETAEVPVVVLTGKDVSPEERRRFGGQIADVVRKGEISLPGLAQRVRELLPALGVAVSDGADPDR